MISTFIAGFPSGASADEYRFNARCSFSDNHTDTQILDNDCEIIKYSDQGNWTGTRINWSDGVVTAIEVLTINREPGDRVSSRWGEAEIDGEMAKYETSSDGGIVFEILSNGKIFSYR
jgi:hypothetical protein